MADPCSICLCEVHTDPHATVLPSCDHSFHVRCLQRCWDGAREPSCPLCRRQVAVSDAVAVLQLPDSLEVITLVRWLPAAQVFRIAGSVPRRAFPHVLVRTDPWEARMRLQPGPRDGMYTAEPLDTGAVYELLRSNDELRINYLAAILRSLSLPPGPVLWRWPAPGPVPMAQGGAPATSETPRP